MLPGEEEEGEDRKLVATGSKSELSGIEVLDYAGEVKNSVRWSRKRRRFRQRRRLK